MDHELFCPRCNRTVLVVRKPIFEGFSRVGEEFTCTRCGMILEGTMKDEPHEDEKNRKLDQTRARLSSLLGETLPTRPVLDDDGTASRLCRYCLHYTINPFRQWCGLHHRDVEATDTCDQFTKAPEPKADSPDDE